MLYADKLALHSSLAKEMLLVRERELVRRRAAPAVRRESHEGARIITLRTGLLQQQHALHLYKFCAPPRVRMPACLVRLEAA